MPLVTWLVTSREESRSSYMESLLLMIETARHASKGIQVVFVQYERSPSEAGGHVLHHQVCS